MSKSFTIGNYPPDQRLIKILRENINGKNDEVLFLMSDLSGDNGRFTDKFMTALGYFINIGELETVKNNASDQDLLYLIKDFLLMNEYKKIETSISLVNDFKSFKKIISENIFPGKTHDWMMDVIDECKENK